MYHECLELILEALHDFMREVDDDKSMTPLHEAYCHLFDLCYGEG